MFTLWSHSVALTQNQASPLLLPTLGPLKSPAASCPTLASSPSGLGFCDAGPALPSLLRCLGMPRILAVFWMQQLIICAPAHIFLEQHREGRGALGWSFGRVKLPIYLGITYLIRFLIFLLNDCISQAWAHFKIHRDHSKLHFVQANFWLPTLLSVRCKLPFTRHPGNAKCIGKSPGQHELVFSHSSLTFWCSQEHQ